MLRRLITRFPHLPNLATLLVFLAGVWWRFEHVFRLHDPRKYVYSDMQLYMDLAKRIARPDYKLQVGDVTHPPGLTELIVWALKTDPSLDTLLWIQFLTAAAIPLAVGLLGYLTFGKSSARWVIVATTIYFPFVDFAGYFLAEIYLALLAPLSLCCYLGALKLSEWMNPGPKRLAALLALGLVGGGVFSLAAIMKMVAMPAIGGFVVVHFLFTHGPPRKLRALVLVGAMLGAAPLMVWQADRCTTANNGQFCTGSNKSAADFLLGHYGRVQGIVWRDPKVGGHMGFGSPAAYQHGYREKPEVPFLITNNPKNYAYAKKWVKKNPGQALVLSFEHVWDIFGGSLTWPTVATQHWPAAQAAQYLFLAFLFFPTLMLLVDVARKRGLLGLLRSNEIAVLAPIFGVMLSVFIATGESRYRIPWDASFLVLGVEFFRRLRVPLREVKEASEDGAPSKSELSKPQEEAPAESTSKPVSAAHSSESPEPAEAVLAEAPTEAEPAEAEPTEGPAEAADDEPSKPDAS